MAAPVAGQDLEVQAASPVDDSAERLALARRFIATMQVEELDQMISAMMQDVVADMPVEKGEVDPQTFERVMISSTTRMVERMLEAMAPVYAEVMTAEELRALVAFYESDIGQSSVRRMYEAAPRMTEVMTEMMPTLAREMMTDLCGALSCTADELREAKAAMDGAFAAE
jgi:hypothetical protein